MRSRFTETVDLGFGNNIEVIRSLLDLQGMNCLDVGCGNLDFTGQLAEFADQVFAIDPDPVQAAKNRQADLPANIQFVEAGAISIPFDDDQFDGIFFAYSLHHIEAESYPIVFEEVFRVLKPGGFVYVIEPVDCPLNQVMRLFHDEELERAAAQECLVSVSGKFEAAVVREYHGYTTYESFDDFAAKFAAKSFNGLYTEDDVRHSDVEAAFLRHGGDDLRFQSPRKVVFLKNFIG